ncbi:hypothetical protein SO802_013207 [Lithocarpus litseifolius]|uniref:EF-hand domain-containing protein n=1 Tax=Lithocarpus litseifolius TaxID=425828 RepID=A0AAW2DAG8_9ROSI
MGFLILNKLLSLENNTNQEEEINNLYEVILKRFDKDEKGLIDRMKFESLVRELMLAMARGIGDLPVLVALEEHSLLMKAVQHEVASLKEARSSKTYNQPLIEKFSGTTMKKSDNVNVDVNK